MTSVSFAHVRKFEHANTFAFVDVVLLVFGALDLRQPSFCLQTSVISADVCPKRMPYEVGSILCFVPMHRAANSRMQVGGVLGIAPMRAHAGSYALRVRSPRVGCAIEVLGEGVRSQVWPN